jgi:hypothetical protein
MIYGGLAAFRIERRSLKQHVGFRLSQPLANVPQSVPSSRKAISGGRAGQNCEIYSVWICNPSQAPRGKSGDPPGDAAGV